MNHTELYDFILKQGRVPYFHKDFPLIGSVAKFST
ncbi:hypothetical protein BN2127_JRS4_00843 [Bacillus cereus]|nr:hypothetical protein BN2127_JRS4_00843 [Bacillus cereus]